MKTIITDGGRSTSSFPNEKRDCTVRAYAILMNIKNMRVRVETDSQMRIAMAILKEVTGLDMASGYPGSISGVMKMYSAPNVVGLDSSGVATWGDHNGNISFEGFLREVASMSKEPSSWKIGCRTVTVKDGALYILNDDITIPKSTLEEMLAALK